MGSREPSSASPQPATAERARVQEICDWLIAAVAERTRLSHHEIQPNEPMYRYGIDSLERVNIAYQLERWIGFAVDESVLANLETIDEIATHLARLESASKP